MSTEGRAQTARPRIAAMDRGPGPARYQLPNLTGSINADLTKSVHPAYSIGKKLGISFFRKDCSPGPAHAIDPSVTYRGKDGAPQYSLSARHKELEAFKTPGPGAYAPERKVTCFQREKTAPSYSMGNRTRFRKRDAMPSPNTYTLPTLLGPRVPVRASSACYSMAGRSNVGGFDTDYARTPGPARYPSAPPDMFQKKAPAYSMLGRSFMPGDTTKKPGPGSHSPEKVNMVYRRSPSYSLGVKHSEYMCPLIIDVSD